MTDLAQLQTDITTWIETLSGLEVEWGTQPMYERIDPYILAYEGSFSSQGADEQFFEYNPLTGLLELTMSGIRQLGLTLSFRSESQTWGENATYYAEKFRLNLRSPTSIDLRSAAKFALVSSGDLIRTDYPNSGRMWSQIDLPLVLAIRFNTEDPTYDGSYIDTINVTTRQRVIDEDGNFVIDEDGNFVFDEGDTQTVTTAEAAEPQSLNVFWLGNSLLGTPDGGGGVNASTAYMVGQIAESLGHTYSFKRQVINGAGMNYHWASGVPAPDDVETELATGNYDVFIMQEMIPIQKYITFSASVLNTGRFHDLYNASHLTGRSLFLEVGCAAYDDGSNGTLGEDFSAPDRDTWRERIEADTATWQSVVDDVNNDAGRAAQTVALGLLPLASKYQTALEDALPFGGYTTYADLHRDGTHPDTPLYYFYALALTAELYDIDVRGAAYSFDSEDSLDGTPMTGLPSESVATTMQDIVYTAWSS